jgi:LysM repeat protein
MKQSDYFKIMRIVFVCSLIVMLSSAIVGQAQEEENLLTNPGFEAPFQSHGGNPPRQVAQGWTPWHTPAATDAPTFENAQPIYDQAAPDVTRIRSGDNAQKYYNDLWLTHDGGIFQRVTGITPGAELRFSVYAWVWSSEYADVDLSEEPGDVVMRVGIDPTGGTNPNSSNIVWSIAVSWYDTYRQHSIITTAADDAVTVFVYSKAGFPAQNTYIYLDDAVLAETVEPEVPTDIPAETDEPEPTAMDTDVPPTNTSVPPTNTSVPPTSTNVPATIEPTEEPPTPTQEGDTPTEVDDGSIIATQPADPTEESEATIAATDGDSPFVNTLTHTVQRGETVGRLAVLYGSTIEAIVEVNELNEDALIYVGQGLDIPVRVPAPATSTPTLLPPTEVVEVPETGDEVEQTTYTVQAGDTLFRIAVRFNTTVATIAELNGIVNANLIRTGQVLVLSEVSDVAEEEPVPEAEEGPVTYTVQSGDNLYRISLRFGVSMAVLSEANGIWNMNKLFAGQVLEIP